MVENAYSADLKQALDKHLQQTRGQLTRLEAIFQKLGREPKRETCEGMKGLLTDADEMAHATGDPEVRDAALIAAAQQIEHYQMAGYGTARTLASRLGRNEVAQLLQATLEEEVAADKTLTQVAQAEENVRARR
jgi:ferritin-like metal-binding protein YciE